MLSVKTIFISYVSLIFLVVLNSCSSVDSVDTVIGSYNSTKLYNKPLFSQITKESMAYEGIARNPVIVIHGFLGSRLENIETGRNVWGDFKIGELLNGYSNEQLKDFSIPISYENHPDRHMNTIKPVGMLETFTFVTLVGTKIQLSVYDKLLRILNQAGYVQEGKQLPNDKTFYSLFTFYYDWRKSIDFNAARLHDFIKSKGSYLKKEYRKLYGIDNYDVQFDIVAHSMGGLLSRYYLRYGNQLLPEDGSLPEFDWRGSKNIDKVIIVGTPNAGYLDSVMQLVNGLKIYSNPFVPTYPPAVIGTFPGVYQMMPLTSTRSLLYSNNPDGKPVNLFDPQVWLDMKWGLADPKQDKFLKLLLPEVKTSEERRKIAIAHLNKNLKKAKQFVDAMRVHKEPPGDVALYLFLGDSLKTIKTAEVYIKTGKLKVTEFGAGDGVVLTSSALMDEREGQKWEPFLISPIEWDAVIYIKAAHLDITESYAFIDNVTHYLLITPTKNQMTKRKYFKSVMETIKKQFMENLQDQLQGYQIGQKQVF